MLTGCCGQWQVHKNPRKNSLDFGGLLYPVQHMDCIIYMNCTINPGLYHNGVIDWDARHHIRSAQRSASRHLSVAISRCNLWLVEPRISLYSRLSVPLLISAPWKKTTTHLKCPAWMKMTGGCGGHGEQNATTVFNFGQGFYMSNIWLNGNDHIYINMERRGGTFIQ